MTDERTRHSPVVLHRKPVKTETRNNWTVVLEYEGEDQGPYLIDLSHRTRWDLQDGNLDDCRPWDIRMPSLPGQCVFEKGIFVNRMNRTQASLWHLAGATPEATHDPAFTDMTDATAFLALLGKDIFSATEKLTSLDFRDPLRTTPFLFQGPFCRVPCQIVTLEKTPQRSGILLTCSRGYARDMTDSILEAGAEFGLRPGGENVFSNWMNELWG
jgi:hypothetical protein